MASTAISEKDKGQSAPRPISSNSPSLDLHRLKLLGSIKCASLRAATELLRRVEVREGATLMSLKKRPELYCELRDAVSKYIRGRFDADLTLELLVFDFGLEPHPALEHIARELRIYGISWPRSFAMRIICRDDQITVSYDEWSAHLSEVVAYQATLLPRH